MLLRLSASIRITIFRLYYLFSRHEAGLGLALSLEKFQEQPTPIIKCHS